MKALIIDETGAVAERLDTSLREEGYSTEVTHSRGEARWALAEQEADVVVVCAARPGLHDLPTVEALRADGEAAPILVLARGAGPEERIAVLDAGADDVVTSPIMFGEIAARLRALLRRPPTPAPEYLRVGDLELDVQSHAATRGQSEPVELSMREVEVLRLMMSHPGQVLTRTRIEEHVWGLRPPESNVVDQVISRLRSKLDRPYGTCSIETIRGVGYRIPHEEALREAS